MLLPEGEHFDWKLPRLSAIEMGPVDRARAVQKAMFDQSLVVMVARGASFMESVEVFTERMLQHVAELRSSQSFDDFSESVLHDFELAGGALRALKGSSKLPKDVQAVQTVMSSKSGALLLTAQAIDGCPAWKQLHMSFTKIQSALCEFSPEIDSHKTALQEEECTLEKLEHAAKRLSVWRDSLPPGLCLQSHINDFFSPSSCWDMLGAEHRVIGRA